MSIAAQIASDRERLQGVADYIVTVRAWDCATPEEEENQRAILLLADAVERALSRAERNEFDYGSFFIRPDTAIALLETIAAGGRAK